MNFKPISSSGSFSTAQKQALAKVLRSIKTNEIVNNLNTPQVFNQQAEGEADAVGVLNDLIDVLVASGVLIRS